MIGENIHLSKRPTHSRRDTDLLRDDEEKKGGRPALLLDQTVELDRRPSTSGGRADVDGQDEGSDTASTIAKRKEFAQALLSSGTSSEILLPRYDLTRKELWAYYLYYVGNSGLPGFNFAPSAYQNLLTLQATNVGNGTCGDTGQPECRLLWGGQMRSPTSIVLLTSEHQPAMSSVSFDLTGAARRWYLVCDSSLHLHHPRHTCRLRHVSAVYPDRLFSARNRHCHRLARRDRSQLMGPDGYGAVHIWLGLLPDLSLLLGGSFPAAGSV